MEPVRASNRLRLRIAPIGALSLRAQLVSLVVLAALVPALLVGVASYLTVQRIQSDESTGRLAERAAGAELQVSRFLETRRIATQAVAGSRTLIEALEAWETARLAADPVAAKLARERLGRCLADVRDQDGLYQGLAVIDLRGALVAATAPSALWKLGGSEPLPLAAGESLIVGTGPMTLAHFDQAVGGPGGSAMGTIRTASTLEPLWRALTGPEEIPSRLRIVNGRLQTLFDSESGTRGQPIALPAAIADRLLDLRVGSATYSDAEGVAVVAAHRFTPSLDFGVVVELPAAEASASGRRLIDSTLRGSLATVALLAILGTILSLHLTRPLRSLVRGIEQAGASDLSHRIPVTANDEVGVVTVAVNQLLDELEKSSRDLRRLADIDELTGLPNRRRLDDLFEVELERANRSHRPLSVLMIDLDHFTAFNERFGRPQGDAFLRHVGSFLETWLRTSDVVARYGGERFAALLPATGREAAVEIAERLRVQFARSHPARAGVEEPVTLSVGVATWSEGQRLEPDLIQAADRALGSAKRNGRNQVRVAA